MFDRCTRVSIALMLGALLSGCGAEDPSPGTEGQPVSDDGAAADLPTSDPVPPAAPSPTEPAAPGPADPAAPTAPPPMGTPPADAPPPEEVPAVPAPEGPEAVALPASETAEAITAFLQAGGHQGEGWTSQTDQPREASSAVSPHGRVRVYTNDTLVTSLAAGNGGFGSESGIQHTPGSMAVKEMYDGADTLVGVAVLLKEQAVDGVWVMYCYGPDTRCTSGVSGTAEAPWFGVDDISCGGCHGGNIFTGLDD